MLDLLIKNGTVVDGSGGARYRADVGVRDGRIVAIGRVSERAARSIDAEGLVVAPGFVDGHTHMDAQVFWDPLGSCSCYHGVTTAVMGNCGFTLAPCAADDADLVFRNLERAEDLPRESLLAGIDWRWETFPQFLDAVDAQPKGINYAGYIGHSALRTYVMGERAFDEAAGEDDLARMCALVKEAVEAGAIGFSTSRTFNHITADDRPVASRVADWSEVRAIVNAMGETGKGVFELAGEAPGRDPERIREYFDRLRDLAVESGVTQTWGMFSVRVAPELWRPYFDLLDETAAAGGRMYAQVHSRALNVLLSFEAHTPFDGWEAWRELRSLPLAEQKARLRDPAVKARLVEVASRPYTGPRVVGAEARPPDWDWVYPMFDMRPEQPSMAELAAARGVHPVALMIDLSLEHDFKIHFRQPIANENQDHVL
jgi:N-acyl-D-amino-acid deacylase